MSGSSATYTTIALDVARISLQQAEAVAHILGCYGADFIAVRPWVFTVVLPAALVWNVLATVQRDVLPVETIFIQ